MCHHLCHEASLQAFKQKSKAINKNGLVVNLIFPNLSPLFYISNVIAGDTQGKVFPHRPYLKKIWLECIKRRTQLGVISF